MTHRNVGQRKNLLSMRLARASWPAGTSTSSHRFENPTDTRTGTICPSVLA